MFIIEFTSIQNLLINIFQKLPTLKKLSILHIDSISSQFLIIEMLSSSISKSLFLKKKDQKTDVAGNQQSLASFDVYCSLEKDLAYCLDKFFKWKEIV